METSILTSIKKLLGIDKEYTVFDTDLIIHINTAFFTLNQLGIGSSDGFSISDDTSEWEDFLEDRKDLEAVKTLVYLKTRLVFDPPQSGFLIDAINKQITELEWRINIQGG